MNKQLEILERRYKNIKESSDDWHFFLGVADYVKYITSQPVFDTLLQEIIKPRKAFEKEMDNLEIRAIKELEVFKGKLLEIIKKSNIKSEEINKDIKEYEGWRDEQITGSRAKCEGMENNIKDILIYLWENGHRKIISEYVKPYKSNPNIPDRFIICDAMDEWERLKIRIEKEKDVALWEDWNNLALVHLAIYEGDEQFAQARKEGKMWDILNLASLLGAMREIREKADGYGQKNNGAVLFFKKQKYLKSLDRIHLYILENVTNEEKNGLYFDPVSSILNIKGKRVLISKKKDSRHHNLLVVISKCWLEEWDTIKIIDTLGDESLDGEKCYQAGIKINTIIASETGIKNFFIVSRKKIQLNPQNYNLL